MSGNLYFYISDRRVGKNFRFSRSVRNFISPRAFARKDWADVVTRGSHTCLFIYKPKTFLISSSVGCVSTFEIAGFR
jgi:hypothetical protein